MIKHFHKILSPVHSGDGDDSRARRVTLVNAKESDAGNVTSKASVQSEQGGAVVNNVPDIIYPKGILTASFTKRAGKGRKRKTPRL